MQNKSEPQVSIIIPSFNSEGFIRECLDSVAYQDYQNIECIIIDDHSTDGTFEVVTTFCEDDPSKFKIFRNIGKGACSARNFGIEKANGKLLKFLDSDDALYDSTVVSRQVNQVNSTGGDIVFGDEYNFSETLSNRDLTFVRRPDMQDADSEFFFKRPITSNFMFRQSPEVLVKWDESLGSGQEFFFLFCCYQKGYRFSYKSYPSAKIRNHKGINRITNKSKTKYADQTLILSNAIEAVILKEGRKFSQRFISAYYKWKVYKSLTARQAGALEVSKTLSKNLPMTNSLKYDSYYDIFLVGLVKNSPLLGYLFFRATNNKIVSFFK